MVVAEREREYGHGDHTHDCDVEEPSERPAPERRGNGRFCMGGRGRGHPRRLPWYHGREEAGS